MSPLDPPFRSQSIFQSSENSHLERQERSAERVEGEVRHPRQQHQRCQREPPRDQTGRRHSQQRAQVHGGVHIEAVRVVVAHEREPPLVDALERYGGRLEAVLSKESGELENIEEATTLGTIGRRDEGTNRAKKERVHENESLRRTLHNLT